MVSLSPWLSLGISFGKSKPSLIGKIGSTIDVIDSYSQAGGNIVVNLERNLSIGKNSLNLGVNFLKVNDNKILEMGIGKEISRDYFVRLAYGKSINSFQPLFEFVEADYKFSQKRFSVSAITKPYLELNK